MNSLAINISQIFFIEVTIVIEIINVLEKSFGGLIHQIRLMSHELWRTPHENLKSLKSLIEANRIGRSLTDIQVELVADLKDEIPIRLVFILELLTTYANSFFVLSNLWILVEWVKTVKSPRPEKVLEKFPGILLKASNTDDAELGKLIKKHKNRNFWNWMFMECWKIEVLGSKSIWGLEST